MDITQAKRSTGDAAQVKVPDVTLAFWIVKIVSTGLGETTSDFFVKQFDPIFVIPSFGLALAIALGWQWLSPTFSKGRYWLAVALVAVFGTMVADVAHVALGVPYFLSTATFGAGLIFLLATWRSIEGSLSIHSVTTRRREAFYWTAVILTFALGTAAGDWTATTLGLGYLLSGILFLVLFALPLLAQRFDRLSDVGAFWMSYILTRPLGASFADWCGVTTAHGGLGIGTGQVSAALLVVAVVIVTVGRFNPALASSR